jgi:predicted cobalt transporter CbtA
LDRRRAAPIRLLGIVVVILPHAIGAPVAEGSNVVPVAIIHQFTIVSILTTGLFWIVLGAIGGLLYGRCGYGDAQHV